jgi:gas vesicle protein
MGNNGKDGAQTGAYLGALAIGFLFGAGIASLCAPCSGREARDILSQKIADLKDAFKRRKAEVVEAIEAGEGNLREARAERT